MIRTSEEVECIIMGVFPEIKNEMVIRNLWNSNKTVISSDTSFLGGCLSLKSTRSKSDSVLTTNAVCVDTTVMQSAQPVVNWLLQQRGTQFWVKENIF